MAGDDDTPVALHPPHWTAPAAEGVERGGVAFGHGGPVVQLAVHAHQRSPGPDRGVGCGQDCLVEVHQGIAAQQSRRPLGAHDHDRRRRLGGDAHEEGRLLQRRGAVGDDDAVVARRVDLFDFLLQQQQVGVVHGRAAGADHVACVDIGNVAQFG